MAWAWFFRDWLSLTLLLLLLLSVFFLKLVCL
jgi:hypothetical protein